MIYIVIDLSRLCIKTRLQITLVSVQLLEWEVPILLLLSFEFTVIFTVSCHLNLILKGL